MNLNLTNANHLTGDDVTIILGVLFLIIGAVFLLISKGFGFKRVISFVALGLSFILLFVITPVAVDSTENSVKNENVSLTVYNVQLAYGIRITRDDAVNLLGVAVDGRHLSNIAYGSIYIKLDEVPAKVTLIRSGGEFKLINAGDQLELPPRS